MAASSRWSTTPPRLWAGCSLDFSPDCGRYRSEPHSDKLHGPEMMTDTRKPAAAQDADAREADPRADEREGDPGEAISVDDLLRAGAEPAREAGLRNEVAELKVFFFNDTATTENVRRRGEREKAEA